MVNESFQLKIGLQGSYNLVSFQIPFYTPYNEEIFFLYFSEEECISSLISSDKIKARHFHPTKLFIDYFCAIKDGGERGRFFTIYNQRSLSWRLNIRVMMLSFWIWMQPSIRRHLYYLDYLIKEIRFPFQLWGCLI